MTIPTGIAAQLGVKAETVFGTAVTVDRFYEITNESLQLDIARLESKGLRANTRVQRSDRWAAGSRRVAGNVEIELPDASLGLLLEHMFGGGPTTPTTPTNGILTRDFTFAPGDLPAGLTMQVGRPDEAGTVQPFTYNGGKVAGWTISAEVDEIGMLGLDMVAKDETTVTALATASFPSDVNLLTFIGGDLKLAGSSVDVRKVELSGSNGLKVDRGKLGDGTIKEPVEAEMRVYDGAIDAYFADLVAYNRFVNGTEAALVLLFQGREIEEVTPTYYRQLEITCNVRFDGETPTVDGPDELDQPLPVKCVDSGAGPGTAITAVYRTVDTAI